MLEIVRAADSEAVGLRFIQRNNSDIDLEHKVAFNMPTIFSDILIEKNNIIDKLSKLRIYVIAHTLTSRKSQNLPTNTNRKNAMPLVINTTVGKSDCDESF